MHHNKRPRRHFTGHGRPVFHNHGSRRALLDESMDDRSAIAEQIDPPEDPADGLEDWERELLSCSTSENYAVPSPRSMGPRRMGDFTPVPYGGFSKERLAEQDRERRAERDRRDREERERWADSASERAKSDASLRSLRLALGVSDRASVRPFVSSNHRVRVSDLGKRLGLDGVQTLYILNGIFNEYAKTSASAVASVVATEVLAWAETNEGSGIIAGLVTTKGL